MEYCIGSASDLVEVHKIPLKEAEISGIMHEAMMVSETPKFYYSILLGAGVLFFSALKKFFRFT